MKKIFILASCLGIILSVQLAYAQTKYCPCPSGDNSNGELCQYSETDASYSQYSSTECKSSTYISNQNYSFCGYGSYSGLPKYCPRDVQVTKYCPCPNGADGFCRYLPQDASDYPAETASSQCQTNLNYLNANNYSFCGYDSQSGLTKYCKNQSGSSDSSNRFCPCPSGTETNSLCQYGTKDSSYDQYNSGTCKTALYISNQGYSFCGYDVSSGLPKYCLASAAPTKYCPCPNGADGFCRYLPQDATRYSVETSNAQCQVNLNYLNANNYSYCGFDSGSGLTKYCLKTQETVVAKAYFCPCVFDGSNYCLIKGTPTRGCKTSDQLAQQGFSECGLSLGTKYCPNTAAQPVAATTSVQSGTGSGPIGTGAGGTPTGGTGAGTNNPGAVFGTGCNGSTATIKTLISCLITDILNPLIYVIMGGAFVTFLNGVRKYIQNANKEDERKKGRIFMFYGIIGLAVMVSVWGIVKILTNSFFSGGLPSEGPIPTIKF